MLKLLFLGVVGMTFSIAAFGQDPEWKHLFTKETWAGADGKGSLNFRQMVPAKLESNQKYPLVLFLHGAGERGSDNEAQLVHGMKDFAKRREEYPAFVIAPQCPPNEKWNAVDWRVGVSSTSETPAPAMQLCRELIDDLIKKHPIDTDRIYITGLSMGGFGTFDAAVRYPDLFAAVAPICGGGDSTDEGIAKIKALPFWIVHGSEDNVVPPDLSRKMVKALEAAGAQPHYVELEGVGHNSWEATYADDAFYQWLFAQKKGSK